ncbi:MAG TPA: RraA family protein [Chloroflexota bacterium]|nr:RraA family protein [Chloroflexota bacterium]
MSDARNGTTTLIERLCAFDSATLYQAAGNRGAMAPGIHSLTPGRRVAGPALTVVCPPGDNLMLHAAVAEARPGAVLVAQVNAAGYGVWGEVLSVAAMARGIVALVIDGSVRDIDSIQELGFPVFAQGTALQTADKRDLGCIGVPISCGGQLVWPADYVVADDSGIVVIPREAVEQTLAAAAARVAKETAIMESLRQGQTTMDLLELRPILARSTEERERALS